MKDDIMDYIIEFYKNLDTVNIIIFWGVIVVVLLLLIFSILIANKNRKLERIIESNGIDIDEYNDNDIPTLKDENRALTQEKEEKTNQSTLLQEKIEIKNKELLLNNNNLMENEAKENKNLNKDAFVAEEHVVEYKKNNIDDLSHKQFNDNQLIAYNIDKKESSFSSKPYQKNILREMSLNQTSPIGIIKNDINNNKEIEKATELYNSFNEKDNNNLDRNKKKPELTTNTTNNYNKTSSFNNKGNYLKELSEKSANLKEKIFRTEYEIKQEEDAIISYEELMQKKDNLTMIDEEEAVISINELLKKSENQEKLYNINNNEDDDIFIDELKNFRSDL
jgi:hypothetical protein